MLDDRIDPAEVLATSRRLRALARALIRDPERAEDVVQDAWVAALTAPHAPRESLGAWLAGAVRRLALRARGRDGGRRAVEALGARIHEGPSPDEAVARVELQRRLAEAVLALDEPERSAVVLRHVEGLDPAAIARRQGCTPEAARQRVARGLARLRARLDDAHGGRERWLAAFAPLARLGRADAVALATTGGLVMGTKLVLGSIACAAAAALWLVVARRDEATRTVPVLHEARAPVEVERAPSPTTGGDARVAVISTAAEPSLLAHDGDRWADELSGRVVDVLGAPVAGAHVEARRIALSGLRVLDLEIARARPTLAVTVTDAAGEFRFELARGEPVDVVAEHDGNEALAPRRHAGERVELVLAPTRVVRGRVLRERDHTPVADARVRAMKTGLHDYVLERETLTASDGRYELRLPTIEDLHIGVFPVHEQASRRLALEFDARGTCELDVLVVDGLTVAGSVTDVESGRPIADALVGESWTFERSARTDANGEYRLGGLGAPGVYELYYRARGYGVVVESLPRDGRLDVALAPARAASGRLVDPSGAPVAAAYVAAIAHEASGFDWSATRSDADGRFRCADLSPAMRHTLLIAAPGRANRVYDFPVDEAQHAELDLGTFELAPQSLVAGTVEDEHGRGLAGAYVTLRGTNSDRRRLAGDVDEGEIADTYVGEREVTTDAEGRFWFAAVAEGRYQLAARVRGSADGPELALEVPEGELVEDVVLRYTGGGTISGRVVDEDGSPLQGATVDASAERARGVTSVTTDEAGDFRLENLPEAEYSLQVLPHLLRNTDLERPWLYSVLEDVPIDGAPVTIVARRGTTIRGTLRDADGQPLYGYEIELRDRDGNESFGWSVVTNTEGRFEVVVAPDIVWTLEVSGPGPSGAAFELLLSVPDVASGTQGLELRLGP